MDTITPVKARKLLSECLKTIGQEETEMVVSSDGEPVLVTKVEALARRLWTMALGGVLEYRNDKGEVVKEFCIPNRQVALIIFERTEGKPKSQDVPGGGKGAKQGQFDSQTQTRLANILNKG